MSDRTEHLAPLEVLLHESAQARDDERSLFAQNALLVPGVLGVITLLAALFYQTCPVGDDTCKPPTEQARVHVLVYVFAPMVPIALVGYMAFISRVMVLRSYYLRILELRIHELTRQKEQPSPPIPSWGHISLEVSGPARAELLSQLNFFIIFGISALMLLGCVWIAIRRIPDVRLSIFALTIDSALMAVPIAVTVSNIRGGADLWKRALAGLPARFNRTRKGFDEKDPLPLNPQPPERSLVSYLILPRNQEEILKALFIPICFLVGWWMAPGVPSPRRDMIWYYVGFFFVFEFLVYQARYLLNDVRDRQVDSDRETRKRRFPSLLKDERDSEGKKPGLYNTALRAAFGSFVVRLALAILLIGLVLPVDNFKWAWHVSFVVGVFIFASIYEGIRSRCNTIGAQHGPRDARIRPWTTALIVFVGFGYGLRSVVGLWLAGVGDRKALVLLFLGASLFGSTFVALCWALESTRAKPEELSARKAHLVPFHVAVSRRVRNVRDTERVLVGGQSLTAPWCWPAILATAALTWFALYLLRDHINAGQFSFQLFGFHSSMSRVVLIAVAELCIASVVVVVSVREAFWLTVLNFLGISILLRWLSVPLHQSVIAAVLAGLPLVVTYIFRTKCFQELPDFTSKLGKALAAGWEALYCWFAKTRSKGQDETPLSTSAPRSLR